MSMLQIPIRHNYLWFPICSASALTETKLLLESRCLVEMNIQADPNNCDFYAVFHSEPYLGQTLTLEGEFPEEWAEKIRQEDGLPEDPSAGVRPELHFTAPIGWINDPNGLIYQDGEYHLFYQHNPYGVQWENMHWGHAVSRDLVHWEHLGEALYPDPQDGPIFSGSALEDRRNLLGYGEGALIFYYTAAGHSDPLVGADFVQRLSYSTDKGRTLHKTDRFCMATMVPGNRDPKIFWHEESKAYIMVLFLSGNDFGIFRSEDLLQWRQTQTYTMPDTWECPNLFRVFSKDGRGKWVFWSADGYYVLGEFDGLQFSPSGPMQKACPSYPEKPLSYAAQVFENTPGRVLMLGWLRLESTPICFKGAMSLPLELSLSQREGQDCLCISPAKECYKPLKSAFQACGIQDGDSLLSWDGRALLIVAELSSGDGGEVIFEIPGGKVTVDFSHSTLSVGEVHADFKGDFLKAEIWVDHGIVEIFAEDGLLYMTAEIEPSSGEIIYHDNKTRQTDRIEIFTIS